MSTGALFTKGQCHQQPHHPQSLACSVLVFHLLLVHPHLSSSRRAEILLCNFCILPSNGALNITWIFNKQLLCHIELDICISPVLTKEAAEPALYSPKTILNKVRKTKITEKEKPKNDTK